MFNFGLVEGARGGRGGAGMSDFGCFSSVERDNTVEEGGGGGGEEFGGAEGAKEEKTCGITDRAGIRANSESVRAVHADCARGGRFRSADLSKERDQAEGLKKGG